MHEYVLAVDVAKRRDFFGIMALKDVPQTVPGNEVLGTQTRIIHFYEIKAIEKYQNLDYGDMVDRIEILMNHVELRDNTDLIVDGTGVGDAVIELIRKRGLYPVPIIFTGGSDYSEVYQPMGQIFKGTAGQLARAQVLKELRVPKKDLVTSGSILLQEGRVRVAPNRWQEEFQKQLTKFRGKVNEKTRRTAYEAENESDHDDLVVCYLMGAWWYLHRKERDAIPERAISDAASTWEPMDYM
jgi:hypothetical protein